MRVARSTEAVPPPTALTTDESSSRDRIEFGSVARASPFGAALDGLGRELDRGESLTDKAIHGGGAHASPERLIALQAGIYRYSEAIDLVTRVVDKGTQAVRTTLQNQ